jgi:biofilm PGA synthesis N-glycosyltransferase PgaC
MNPIAYFIVTLGIMNVIRMLVYLLSSDIYTVKEAIKNRKNLPKKPYTPTISIIVPAHNESLVIRKTLESLQASNYPKSKMEIIVVNDGSTDDTSRIVRNYIAQLGRSATRSELHRLPRNKEIVRRFVRYDKPYFRTKLVNQRNGGKADALNNALKNYATGKLIMCLDADSLVHPDMVRKSVAYFRDRRVVALASNVNIMENGSVLSLVQRFEYLVSYHMKKAQTTLNIEYIIGGIGSVFRSSTLKKVGYYDTNTMTEDIDLTMKIIARGNKKQRVVYAQDALTYTEAVPSFKSLIKQRFRWKYGRMQTFLKNPAIFFNVNKKYSKQLTWFILPFAIFQEITFLFEPVVVSYIFYTSIKYKSPQTMIFAMLVISSYLFVNIWSSSHLSRRERLRLTLLAPPMYLLMYMMSVVEYTALAQAVIKLPQLRKSISGEKTTWKSPERTAIAAEA